ncbi:uncharacterized protein RBU57_007019 [Macrochelys suwanniensis]
MPRASNRASPPGVLCLEATRTWIVSAAWVSPTSAYAAKSAGPLSQELKRTETFDSGPSSWSPRWLLPRCAERNRHPVPLSSVRGDPPAPSSGRHRSPSHRQRKAPSSHRRRDKDKGEARPMCGSPNSPLGPSAPTHAERNTRMPSTPKAFQAAKNLLTLQVLAVPAPGVRSRGKPPLGSRPSTPTRHRSRSRDRSRGRSSLSARSDHSPQLPQSPMVRLSGKVLSDQSSGHLSRLSRESRHGRHRRRRRSRSSRSYRSRSRHGRRRSRSSSRSSRHQEHDSRKRSTTPHHRGHRRRSVSRSSSSRRYCSSSSESRS